MIEAKSNSRPGVPNVVIVLVDGPANNPNQVQPAAQELHDAGYYVFATGVYTASQTELETIASDISFVIKKNSFTELNVAADEVGRLVCTELYS